MMKIKLKQIVFTTWEAHSEVCAYLAKFGTIHPAGGWISEEQQYIEMSEQDWTLFLLAYGDKIARIEYDDEDK